MVVSWAEVMREVDSGMARRGEVMPVAEETVAVVMAPAALDMVEAVALVAAMKATVAEEA